MQIKQIRRCMARKTNSDADSPSPSTVLLPLPAGGHTRSATACQRRRPGRRRRPSDGDVSRESRLSNHSNFQLLAAAEAAAALTECRPAAADAIVVVVEWNGERRGKKEKSYRFLLAL